MTSLGGFVKVNGQGVRNIRAAADLPKERFALTYVNLNSKGATDAGLANLRGCKGLTDLWLLYGAGVTDDQGWPIFEGLAELRSLGLDATKVTDAGMPRLGGLKRLRHLGLSGT